METKLTPGQRVRLVVVLLRAGYGPRKAWRTSKMFRREPA